MVRRKRSEATTGQQRASLRPRPIGDAPHIKKGTNTHNVVPPQGMQSKNGDVIYMKALNHSFSMDYVTVNKLHSMINGEASKSTVRKLIKRMVKDGFLSSNNETMGRSVIRSPTTEIKLLEMKKMLDGNSGEQKTLSNSFKLSLDGTPEQVEKNFKKFIKEVRRWYYRNGVKADVSSILGRSKEVYTTPGHGTLYVDVMYKSVCVTFVIQARHGWLRGYLVDDVAHELKPDVKGKFYMPHPKHRELPFKGNHHKISGGDPGGLIIGLDKLRKSLKSIIDCGSNPDPETIGIFTLYLCEGLKFQPVFNQLCKSLVCPSNSRLEMDPDRNTMNDLLRSWSHFSENIMRYVDYAHQGFKLPELRNKHDVPAMDSIEKYINCVRILHLDDYNEGVFHFKGPTDPDIWEDKEICGVVRMHGVSGKEEKLNYRDTDKRKQAIFSKGGAAAAKQQSLKPNASHIRQFATSLRTEDGIGCWIKTQYQRLLKTEAKSCCGFINRQVPMPMNPIFPINTGIIGGMTRIIQQFKGKVDAGPKTLPHNQIKMARPHNWLGSPCLQFSNSGWFKNQVPMPKSPIFPINTGGMTRIIQQFKGKADGDPKTMLHNQIEMAHPHNWPGSPSLQLSNSGWFKNQVPMPNSLKKVPMPKCPSFPINTGIIGGITRIIQQFKGKGDGDPKRLLDNQIKMANSEHHTKTRFSVRAFRIILGVLRK